MPGLMTFSATVRRGWVLLGFQDHPHPALPDLPQDPVAADLGRQMRRGPRPRAGVRIGRAVLRAVSRPSLPPSPRIAAAENLRSPGSDR